MWGGNHDIQYILNAYSVCQYVVSYIEKSYRGMSKLMKKVAKECKKKNQNVKDQLFTFCREFQGASEISSQEVGYNLMQLPLTTSSRTKVRINTFQPQERVRMLKSFQELCTLPEHSEDIFYANIFQRYAKRDVESESVSLIDFVSDRLTNRRTKIILYYSPDKNTQYEEFCRVQLLLFIPWRNEHKLTGDLESYSDCYIKYEQEINQIRSYYHKMETHLLEKAISDIEQDVSLVPIVDEEEMAAKAVNKHQNKNLDEKNFIPPEISNELGFDYMKDDEFSVKKRRMNFDEMSNLFRSLDLSQKEIFL